MSLNAQLTLPATCLALALLVGVAAADPAPIVYASVEGADAISLVGGDERSYGYGATTRARGGAVVDLTRRANTEQGPPASHGEAQPAAWLEQERVGPPYEANGRWYVPTPEPGYAQTGMASWYGPTFHGQRTASGETFDQEALTAAHPTLPIPSLVQVTNLENGREIIVRVNDRGPFVGDRLIDLSRRSAEVLGFETAGQARVHVRYLGPAPRRVTPDGSSTPASTPRTPPRAPATAQEGPMSLLPQPIASTEVRPTIQSGVAAAPLGAYFVQIGAFSDIANANHARTGASAAGPVEVDIRRTQAGAELFRVRVGPWANRADAETARGTLRELGFADAIVAAP